MITDTYMNGEYIDHLQNYLRKISNNDCIPDNHYLIFNKIKKSSL